MHVGKLIRRWRESLDLDQEQFTDLLNEQLVAIAKVQQVPEPRKRSTAGVISWEAERSTPHYKTLEAIVRAFGCRRGEPLGMPEFYAGPGADQERAAGAEG